MPINESIAPVCPVSRSQTPSAQRPGPLPVTTTLPIPPVATDLPSLIRSVNITLDVLRQITTSLTINNTYEVNAPPVPAAPPQTNYLTSLYPGWSQNVVIKSKGYMYFKDKNGPDDKQRAYIERTDAVIFNNTTDGDGVLVWNYSIPFDSG